MVLSYYKWNDTVLPEYSYLREEIIRRRNERGWSQAQLADRAQVSQSLISKLERGDRIPNYERLHAIWAALQDSGTSDEATVSDVMEPEIVGVAADTSVLTAGQLMKQRDFSQLPVTDNDRYIGMVLSKDIAGVVHDQPDMPVRAVMRSLPTLPHDAPQSQAQQLLLEYNALLVTRQGTVVGIITPHNLL